MAVLVMCALVAASPLRAASPAHGPHLAPLACGADPGVLRVQGVRRTIPGARYFAPVSFATFYSPATRSCARAELREKRA